MSPIEEKLHAALEDISDHERFARFVALLLESLAYDGEWDNKDLASFIQGLAVVANELNKWYDGPGEAEAKSAGAHWQFLAEMLFAARCARKK